MTGEQRRGVVAAFLQAWGKADVAGLMALQEIGSEFMQVLLCGGAFIAPSESLS